MVDGGAWFGGGERGKRGLFCWMYRRFGRKSPRLQEREGRAPFLLLFFQKELFFFFFFFALVFSSPEFLFFGLSLYVFPISGFLSGLLVCSLFSREFFLM